MPFQVGTGVTNALIKTRKAVDKSFADEAEAEDVPIVSTSIAYGVYMAVSSNLRCVILHNMLIKFTASLFKLKCETIFKKITSSCEWLYALHLCRVNGGFDIF